MRYICIIVSFLWGICFGDVSFADKSDGWYTEGDYEPKERIVVTISNILTIENKECPIVIARKDLPLKNLPERFITPVDPTLPSNAEPTAEQFKKFGTYLMRKETFGHILEYQQDDLDKDGIWDELFFMVDLKPRETKTIYLYIGEAMRGLFEHKTHSGMGYYGRHVVPFWESQYIGWKLWFPTDVDLHGKRTPMLTAYPEYQKNLAGYFMPPEYGTDIMTVSNTFGAGGVCLFEVPAEPDSMSRARFTPYTGKGPLNDTRFSFDTIANGSLRSIMKAKTMNWRTGMGDYECEQVYTAYARKSYSTCHVTFTTFNPEHEGVMFGCGIRKIMNEYDSYQKGGTVISFGKDINPLPGYEYQIPLIIKFEGIALVVKNTYKPEYRNVKGFGGNHVMKVPLTPQHTFEYMIAGGWSEGTVNNTQEEFIKYVTTEAEKYNHPPRITVGKVEEKIVGSKQ